MNCTQNGILSMSVDNSHKTKVMFLNLTVPFTSVIATPDSPKRILDK
jgi:hypothetical protein